MKIKVSINGKEFSSVVEIAENLGITSDQVNMILEHGSDIYDFANSISNSVRVIVQISSDVKTYKSLSEVIKELGLCRFRVMLRLRNGESFSDVLCKKDDVQEYIKSLIKEYGIDEAELKRFVDLGMQLAEVENYQNILKEARKKKKINANGKKYNTFSEALEDSGVSLETFMQRVYEGKDFEDAISPNKGVSDNFAMYRDSVMYRDSLNLKKMAEEALGKDYFENMFKEGVDFAKMPEEICLVVPRNVNLDEDILKQLLGLEYLP